MLTLALDAVLEGVELAVVLLIEAKGQENRFAIGLLVEKNPVRLVGFRLADLDLDFAVSQRDAGPLRRTLS